MLHHHLRSCLHYEELFGFFPMHIRSQLTNKSEVRTHKKGETIFKRGEEGDWMGAILAGRVGIVMHSIDHSKEMLLSFFDRGQVFGERALLDGLPRGADAVAREDTTFLVIKREVIMPLLFQYPEAMYFIVKVLCNRLLRYTETMELYSLQDVSTRLASFILYLGFGYGKESEGKLVINAGHNQADLGKRIATSRESVNRQLKIFADQGLISINGDEITVLDRKGLEALCEPLDGERPLKMLC